MQIPPAAKYVKARVVEARNLISMDSNGFSDPFTVVIFNDNKKDARTTEIIYKTLNPVWADTNEFTFRVVSSLTDTLKFVVWDFDKIGLNDYEGQVTVPIAAAAAKPGEPLDSWVPLVNKKGKADKDRGELHVIITYLDTGLPKPVAAPKAVAASDVTASSASSTPTAPTLEVISPRTAAAANAAANWKIPFGEINLLKELGRGQFGVVYKGKWRLQDCAIKVIPSERLGEKELREFRDEITLMASIRPHRNLVTFLGVSMDEGHPLCLVTDFVDGGSLESKYMDPHFSVDWAFVLRIAKGVCAGMHHLHEEGLLHRDLAARNILLTASMEPVVADFGLSKKVDKLHQSSRDNVVQETTFFRGPYKWMAPESLKFNTFSKKTDVWSYGVTLWELMARSLPFNDIDIYTAADYIVNRGLRCPLSPTWPPRWSALLVAIWDVNPDTRPGFVEVSARLDEIEAEMLAFSAK